MTLSENAVSSGWLRLLGGLLAAVVVAGLVPAAHAGNHGNAGGPPDGRGGPPFGFEEEADGVVRVSGPNRFFTSIALSQYTHPDGADEVFIATGGGFADALAGAPAAAAADAPVLFTPPGNVGHISNELQRLEPETVTVVGGPAAVEERILDQIAGLFDGDVAVQRLGGGDRFATAVAVSQYTHPDGADEVFLATGGRFPDALAGAPVAASLDAPVLLTGEDMLPETTTAELERLAPQTVTVLGGPGAISEDVTDAVTDATGAEIRRIAGDDRFGTAIAASQFLSPDGDSGTVFVATGLGWADALAGAAAAGGDAAPVLLTTPGGLPDAVADELVRLGPDPAVVLGGPGAITGRVATQISEALAGDGGAEDDGDTDDGEDGEDES